VSTEQRTSNRRPAGDDQPVGPPTVIDLRDGSALPQALLREAYEERLHLLVRGAGQDELDASALRVRELEAALQPARRLPRRALEPSIFLG